MSLPKNTIDITSVEPQVVIEIVGHLIEFLIDTSAALLVLTQGIGSFNNHKKYGREFQERDREHFTRTPFLQHQWPVISTLFSVCA